MQKQLHITQRNSYNEINRRKLLVCRRVSLWSIICSLLHFKQAHIIPNADLFLSEVVLHTRFRYQIPHKPRASINRVFSRFNSVLLYTGSLIAVLNNQLMIIPSAPKIHSSQRKIMQKKPAELLFLVLHFLSYRARKKEFKDTVTNSHFQISKYVLQELLVLPGRIQFLDLWWRRFL